MRNILNKNKMDKVNKLVFWAVLATAMTVVFIYSNVLNANKVFLLSVMAVQFLSFYFAVRMYFRIRW